MADSTQRFDVVVAGLGAAGSACAYQLARRGLSVAGVDRHHPPHDLGSSHGSSRIFREAYAEDPLYVPILTAAFDGWRELEILAERELLVQCGGLMIGPPDCELIGGVRLSAERHGLPIEELSTVQLERRYGGVFAAANGTVALYDPRAGFLKPEACIEAMQSQAEVHDARLSPGAAVVGWSADDDGVRVELADGSALEADWLVLSLGAWLGDLAPDLSPHLTVARQVLHWFESTGEPGRLSPAHLPIFIWEHDPPRLFYGFPDHGEGLKVAIHHEGEVTTAETVEREVSAAEVEAAHALTERLMPGAAGAWLRSAVCMYTNTPDGHFLLDRHEEHERVIVASPCSGHGFKFMVALGAAVADLVTGAEPAFDIAPFRLARLAEPGGTQFRVRTGGIRFRGQVRK